MVVGGGLAGITAALRLADRGATVTLLESRPRLGGATCSFRRGDLAIDNGQHVFLRCCTAYRSLLLRLGVEHETSLQDRLAIPVLRPVAQTHSQAQARSEPAWLRRSALPAPLHMVAALARYRALPLADRLRAVRAAQALRRLDPADPELDQQDFATWLSRHGQSSRAVAALWGLITTATLNAPPERASLALAAMVFRTGLLTRTDAGDLGIGRVPLDRLHAEPARRVLRSSGVDVRLRQRVRAIDIAGVTDVADVARDGAPGRLAVVLDDGSLTADAVVLAVPHDAAATLLPQGALPDVRSLRRLGTTPIVNVHVVYERPVTDLPFAAALDSPVQWVFDRTAASGLSTGQYLAVTVSAAEGIVDQPTAVLRTTFLAALEQLFPRGRGVVVSDFFVTRERAATFRQAPGSGALRPGCRTPVRGLFLAGAWTDTGWPATMEGAVRSGETAADAVMREAAVREEAHALTTCATDAVRGEPRWP